MTDNARERLTAALRDGDDEGVADALALLEEGTGVAGAYSGEILMGIAIVLQVYGDKIDQALLSRGLAMVEPEDLKRAAWNLEGRGYSGKPANASEFAEKVALMIAIFYLEAADDREALDLDQLHGAGQRLLPDEEGT